MAQIDFLYSSFILVGSSLLRPGGTLTGEAHWGISSATKRVRGYFALSSSSSSHQFCFPFSFMNLPRSSIFLKRFSSAAAQLSIPSQPQPFSSTHGLAQSKSALFPSSSHTTSLPPPAKKPKIRLFISTLFPPLDCPETSTPGASFQSFLSHSPHFLPFSGSFIPK